MTGLSTPFQLTSRRAPLHCPPHWSRLLLPVPRGPYSPWGEGGPKGRMGGPSLARKRVPPHQFGRMTYGRAIKRERAAREAGATASHGLTSSPRRGEAKPERASDPGNGP